MAHTPRHSIVRLILWFIGINCTGRSAVCTCWIPCTFYPVFHNEFGPNFILVSKKNGFCLFWSSSLLKYSFCLWSKNGFCNVSFRILLPSSSANIGHSAMWKTNTKPSLTNCKYPSSAEILRHDIPCIVPRFHLTSPDRPGSQMVKMTSQYTSQAKMFVPRSHGGDAGEHIHRSFIFEFNSHPPPPARYFLHIQSKSVWITNEASLGMPVSF